MKFKRGDNVFTEAPQELVRNCCSITGDVTSTHHHGQWVTVDAYVAMIGGGYPVAVSLRTDGIGIRHGTPISKISTQPGTPGYSEWLRISRSWGH